jgi:predicted alpha/beta hydrolase family esterase
MAAMRSVLIGYSWDGRSDKQWLFWLEKKLETMGFKVKLINLPKLSADMQSWLPDLEKTYGVPDRNVHIVEHDPGCLTILSYLEHLTKKSEPEPTLLVAGQSKYFFRTQPENAFARRKLMLSESQEISGHAHSTPAIIRESLTNDMDVKLVVIYGGIISEKIEEPKQQKLPPRKSFFRKLLGA